MKRLFSLLVIGLLVISLAACGSTEEPQNQDLAPSQSKGIFYEVIGGKNQVYLFGSVHVGHEDMYPLDDAVMEAFAQSDVLGLELDMANVSEMALAQEILEFALLEDGKQMTDIVSSQDFAKLAELVAPLGINQTILNQFQPWYGGMILAELAIADAGLSPDYGIENFFIEQAEDMEVFGLETIAGQLSPYLLLSDESQAIYLERALQELEEDTEEELHQLIEYWQQGNVEAMASLRKEMMVTAPTESYERYQRAFLDGRDENMTQVILELLESDSGNTYFIVVGSLHLVGENSIVELLIEQGYELKKGN